MWALALPFLRRWWPELAIGLAFALLFAVAAGYRAQAHRYERQRDDARAALAALEAAGAAQDQKATEATKERQKAAQEYGDASIDALARVADDRDSLAVGLRRAAGALGTCEVQRATDRAAADARALESARREAEIDAAVAEYDAECRADTIVRDFWADLWPRLKTTEVH